MPIVDPIIAATPSMWRCICARMCAPCIGSTYAPLNDGLRSHVFVMDARTSRPLEGRVWPANTSYFVDFSHPATVPYWTKQLNDFQQLVNAMRSSGVYGSQIC